MRRFVTDDPWSTLLLLLLLILVVAGCRFSMSIRSVKAQEMPPLLLEYYLPSIHNHPLSIGEPPDPIR